MRTITFVQVAKNFFDPRSETDPDALYMIKISGQNVRCSAYSGRTRKDIERLLKHFGVNNPNELAGKTFKVPDTCDHKFTAIDNLLSLC